MKIMQYNILDGCRDQERYGRLSNWLKMQDCDVVGFNELNDWTSGEFDEEMKKIGFSYSYLFEAELSPYYVGIAAKDPIEVIGCVEDEPIYHGLLQVRIKGIHFLISHLTPFESKSREKETEYIADCVRSITEPVVVMGDFNTLSPHDAAFYKEMNTVEKIKRNSTQKRTHLVSGHINYKPMENLLDTGLYDVSDLDAFSYSFPTKIKGELTEPSYLRIDYILVNEKLLTYRPKVSIINDSDVEMLSDHYPVCCILDS
ncbi:endonuclease/exonuclease/phosphatase family protein [Virgibacillus doumboii]|uniref:endonuclease/exonuclease/phosphatase family protein n=1 Tax=Virgibacillus doumboii TaxID=2697503 RepID=UPI0013DF00C5|nr:endonuclease/exonuclease/phosphatase family protein [Virgibacillus doumboii]